MRHSDHEQFVLATAAQAVRFLTIELVVRMCASLRMQTRPLSHRAAKQLLLDLGQRGLLQRRSVFVRRIPPFESPIFRWIPGDPPPDGGPISYRVRQRFRESELRQTTVYLPTHRTFAAYAQSRTPVLKRTQTSHDLGVAEMFLYVCSHHPDWVERWRGEDCYAAMRGIGEKVEDAVILKSDSSEPELALEFLGASYDKERLLALHHDLERRSLPYMWF